MKPHESHHPEPLPYGTYVKVWFALIALTIVTVGVSYVDMGNITVFTALVIALVKGGLVLLYFMHIRYEKPLYGIMIIIVLVTYVVFITLTFTDYGLR